MTEEPPGPSHGQRIVRECGLGWYAWAPGVARRIDAALAEQIAGVHQLLDTHHVAQGWRVGERASHALDLTQRLDVAFREVSQLRAALAEREAQIKELERRLARYALK